MSSCEGPAGPAGTDGIAGIDGIDGTDGTDGVAGNAVCMACHNNTVKGEITAEWKTSLHATSQSYYPYSPTLVEDFGGRNDVIHMRVLWKPSGQDRILLVQDFYCRNQLDVRLVTTSITHLILTVNPILLFVK